MTITTYEKFIQTAHDLEDRISPIKSQLLKIKAIVEGKGPLTIDCGFNSVDINGPTRKDLIELLKAHERQLEEQIIALSNEHLKDWIK